MTQRERQKTIKYGFVYEIVNLNNNKRYIGSTVNVVNRKQQHFWYLKNNQHHSAKLQRAYNKYGREAFQFNVLIGVINAVADLGKIEQQYMDALQPEYNILPNAQSSKGRVVSQQTRAKLSASLKGKPGNNKGKKFSEEHKAKMSASLKGRKSPMEGKKFSEEHKAKLSAAHTGKKYRPLTDEEKQIRSKALKAYFASNPEEIGRKKSEANKAYWERKRNGA